MPVIIRTATAADSPAIAEIYRHYVEHTVITFDYRAPSASAWETKRSNIIGGGRPFLVADHDGTVVGFAYLSTFRDKQAYDWTAEDTIYLHPDHVGHGTGGRLLAALLDSAFPVRRVVAVIAAVDNGASIHLHAKYGFRQIGTLERAGFKHNTWVDCVLMQHDIDPADDADAPPTPG